MPLFKYFTPTSYFFFFLYVLLIIFLTIFSDFYVFWVIIELSSLVFMGLSFSVFCSGYSQLISYFLIQSLSSLFLLISFINSSSLLFSFSVFINLSIFPFFFWFFNLMVRFSNFILFLSISFHNIPGVLLVFYFNLNLTSYLLLTSLLASSLLSGVFIISTNSLRCLFIFASVGNNSWFILSQYVNILFFFSFLLVYSVFLFLSFSLISSQSSESLKFNGIQDTLSVLILSISGLPPFPLFFLKLSLIFFLLNSFFSLSFSFIFLFFSSFMLIGYIHFLFNYFVNIFSNLSL